MGPDSSGQDLIRGIKPEDDDLSIAPSLVQTSLDRGHHRRASAEGEDASGKGQSGFECASLRVTPRRFAAISKDGRDVRLRAAFEGEIVEVMKGGPECGRKQATHGALA